MLEKRRVLLQFVSDLVNDVITGSDAVAFQFEWQRSRVTMDYMNTWIICKLSLQITRERRIQLKQEQMRIRSHPSRDFARVHAFTRPVLGDDAWPREIHLTGDAFHHRSRAGNNGGDLKRTLQAPLEKKCAHGIEIVVRTPEVVQ